MTSCYGAVRLMVGMSTRVEGWSVTSFSGQETVLRLRFPSWWRAVFSGAAEYWLMTEDLPSSHRATGLPASAETDVRRVEAGCWSPYVRRFWSVVAHSPGASEFERKTP